MNRLYAVSGPRPAAEVEVEAADEATRAEARAAGGNVEAVRARAGGGTRSKRRSGRRKKALKAVNGSM